MLILPHSADLSFSQKPWVTWSIMLLSLIIYIAQIDSREKVVIAAVNYCGEVFSSQKSEAKVAWVTPLECTSDMYQLRSLPDPAFFITPSKQYQKHFKDWSKEEIDSYFQTLQTHYPEFALTSPASLDAGLMYDPTVLNPWRMITSALAHADWWHLLGNLIFFMAFAPLLELIAGKFRFVLIMLLITVVDSLAYSVAVAINGWPAPTYGLSGVVFGMIGLSAFVAPKVRIRTLVWFLIYIRNHSIPAWVLAIWFVGWNIFDMMTKDTYGGTNLVAHISGAFAGYFIGFYLMKEKREQYADILEDQIELQRGKRGSFLKNDDNAGYTRRLKQQREMRTATEDYESRMEDIYLSVRSENDSTAILMLLEQYDLWSESPDVYDDIYQRMQQWGKSRALLCIGRLTIHLYASKGKTARAQAIVIQCLKYDPTFALADRMDLGKLYQNANDRDSQLLVEQLMKNGEAYRLGKKHEKPMFI